MTNKLDEIRASIPGHRALAQACEPICPRVTIALEQMADGIEHLLEQVRLLSTVPIWTGERTDLSQSVGLKPVFEPPAYTVVDRAEPTISLQALKSQLTQVANELARVEQRIAREVPIEPPVEMDR